jgi:DNA-binding MarR family transcriptional regulator
MSKSRVSFDSTLRVRDACLCMHMQRTARSLARRFDAAFRPVGLTSRQFSLMMALNRPDPSDIGSVAALLGMDRTTLTAALKPLVRRGLVEIVASRADRRRRLLRLTMAGGRRLAAALPIWEREHAAVESGVDGEQLRRDLRVLG